MPNSGSIIPISDEQAKAAQEALKTLQGLGGYLKQILGTVPEDLVGMLGGDWLKVRRAENIKTVIEKARERLKTRDTDFSDPASLSVALPLLEAAADESREELQDIWARLLAAAADPSRARYFRTAFISVAKTLDPLDAAVLNAVRRNGGQLNPQARDNIAKSISASIDQVDISAENLAEQRLLDRPGQAQKHVTAFGREFLLAVSD